MTYIAGMNITISLPDNHLPVQAGLPIRYGDEEVGIVSNVDMGARRATIEITNESFAEELASMFELAPPAAMLAAPIDIDAHAEPDGEGDGEGDGE